jgi:hypothetical protein
MEKEGAMKTWNVQEVVLEARYFNHDTERLTLPCNSVTEIPAQYVEDRGADGAVMRSEIVPLTLLVNSIDHRSLEAITWEPNRLLFRALRTGESKEFECIGYSREGDAIRFLVRQFSVVSQTAS